MPIAINGSGTITGISVGGLENGCVNEADLANAAVTETKLASNAVTIDKLGTTLQSQLCKAWVNFNGTSTVAIRASYNVSSITDNGTGSYAVNFTNSMPDANYSLTGTTQYSSSGQNCWVEWSDSRTSTTGKVEIHIARAGALEDSQRISIAIFR